MKYKCSRCGLSTEISSDIKKHINRKTLCLPVLNESDPTVIQIEHLVPCDYCKKSFFDGSNLKRHLKTCKARKVNLETEIVELRKQLEDSQKQLLQRPITNNAINTRKSTEFACSLCGYQSYLKTHVKTHIKNRCGSDEAEILEIPVEIMCEFCYKEFTTRPSMKRHLRTCKAKKLKEQVELEEQEEQEEQLEEALANPSN